jgi:hypothetical protein
VQPFRGLDTLWVQVSGTVCNLACTHCLVTAGPGETRHGLMSRAEVAARVREALALGVNAVYFTGGEPFVNPEFESIVEDTLTHAPVTVLTNGTLFTARRVAWLTETSARSRHSLELRVSLDGAEAATHEARRGPGSWARTMTGLRALEASGLLPIVTFTRPHGEDEAGFAARCRVALAAEGLRADRLKLLPLFALGREAGSGSPVTLAGLPPEAFDPERLQCGACRAVTTRGVFVCPLLVDEPGGRLGDSLAEATSPFPLAHPACATCWATGMTCANA